MQSSEELLWEQSYDEIISTIPDLIFDDPFDLPSSPPGPKSPIKGPRGGVGKPAVRRRSRSSKKAPTMLLTADAKNFRALVQQFTGRHSGSPLLRAYKGPVNLNFKQRNYHTAEYSDGRFFPFGGKIDDGESRIGQNPRKDGALTWEEDFVDVCGGDWGKEVMEGDGDYVAVLNEAVDRYSRTPTWAAAAVGFLVWAGYGELVCGLSVEGVLNSYAVVVQIRVDNSFLCGFYENANAPEIRGLVVAVDPDDYVSPSPQHDAYCCGEDGYIGYGIVRAGNVNGRARVGLLVSVSSDSGVLSEETGAQEGLVAPEDQDPQGGEVEEKAIGDADSGRVDHQ
ncbi:hypothetical protein SASPL_139633 [Salvia splendens]|uniref:VQ domain-containing protein n=1 Tax=Salvia splendens TaxID=180675 RepID=A0A8X8WQ29_SALSN|nr:hypothetical protein SASPL_139633 [Salvia splendens]